MMSQGYSFLQYVEALREIGCPVDKVSGGDIYSVYKMNTDIKDAVVRLHEVVSERRKMKQRLKTPE